MTGVAAPGDAAAPGTPAAAGPPKPTVGWIGLGRIGAPMAARVQAAGWPLVLWARRGAAAPAVQGLIAGGARLAPTGAELAGAADIVCTIVTGPEDVRALHAELMPQARPGTLFIDMTTATPATAAASADLAARHGLRCLDAPVTGGVAGAERGTLSSFIGGDAGALDAARALLGCFSQRLVPCGAAGGGYRVKLINQTLVAGVLMGMADAARIARAAGLDAATLQPALAGGTGESFLLHGYLARMMAGEGPVTFTLALLLKDLRLARGEAHALGLAVPLLEAAIAAVEAAIDRHGGDAGVQALA